MDSKLWDFDIKFDLLDIGVEVGFGSTVFVDVYSWYSHHDTIRVAFLFILRVVHVNFDYNIFNFDFDVKKDLFEGFLEEVHGVVFAKLFSGKGFIDFKKGVLLNLFHAFLEVFVEILVRFEFD